MAGSVSVKEIFARFPGRERELMEAAEDAVDMADFDISDLFFVCRDVTCSLNENGISISSEEFMKICRAAISSGAFD